jgi:4-methyl-5(b-hydroxyethyl)-thiazole monophosphate biosynthesis
MKKRVLCLLVGGFEEIEMMTPVDLLRRAGAEVVLASVLGEKVVTGRSGVKVQADATLEEVANQEFDLLLIPGGPGTKALRADGRPAQLAKAYAQRGKPIGAICAAPTVLADAGVLGGKRFTAHYSVHEELPQARGAERVVEDGNIITSRGAGTALDFGLALVNRLFGAAAAQEVAKAIMA